LKFKLSPTLFRVTKVSFC